MKNKIIGPKSLTSKMKTGKWRLNLKNSSSIEQLILSTPITSTKTHMQVNAIIVKRRWGEGFKMRNIFYTKIQNLEHEKIYMYALYIN